MIGDTPEAAAREVAARIVCDQLAWAKQLVPRDPVCARVHLAQAITAALLFSRRAALEEAAKVCERRIVITEHGERDIVIAEPSPEHAKSIRALAGSTQEGE